MTDIVLDTQIIQSLLMLIDLKKIKKQFIWPLMVAYLAYKWLDSIQIIYLFTTI